MKLRQLILGTLLITCTHSLYATDDIDYYAWLYYTIVGAELAENANLAIDSAIPPEDNKVSRRAKHREWQLNISPKMVVSALFDKPKIRQTKTVSI